MGGRLVLGVAGGGGLDPVPPRQVAAELFHRPAADGAGPPRARRPLKGRSDKESLSVAEHWTPHLSRLAPSPSLDGTKRLGSLAPYATMNLPLANDAVEIAPIPLVVSLRMHSPNQVMDSGSYFRQLPWCEKYELTGESS